MAKRHSDKPHTRMRGRPKGTGIDDARVLTSILGLISADRNLKPTTAIKRAGITDPSAIRRLRDKLRSEAGQSHQTPVAALALPRAARVTAELPVAPAALTLPPAVAADTPPTPLPAPSESIPESAPEPSLKHPPLAAETEKRTREALLLAAYLDAMAKTPPPTPEPQVRVGLTKSPLPEAPRDEPSTPQPAAPTTEHPPRPAETRQPSAQPVPPQSPFNFPGMPPFLQPFRQAAAPQSTGTSQAQQLEGMKLAVEAMTSMTRLQLHITENVFAYSPMALMLQGQNMVGQMLLASFTGQLDAMKPKKPDGTT